MQELRTQTFPAPGPHQERDPFVRTPRWRVTWELGASSLRQALLASEPHEPRSADGLIPLGLSDADSRMRIGRLPQKCRALHESILGLTLECERPFLSVVAGVEREALIDLLKGLHAIGDCNL